MYLLSKYQCSEKCLKRKAVRIRINFKIEDHILRIYLIQEGAIITTSKDHYHICLAQGYIPKRWSLIRATVVPKPGKSNSR